MLTGVALLWALAQAPFAGSKVNRNAVEIRKSLQDAMAQKISAAWLIPRLETGLVLADEHEVQRLSGLATKYGVPISSELWTQIDALTPQTNQNCTSCRGNIHACQTAAHIELCTPSVAASDDVAILKRLADQSEPDQLNAALTIIAASATRSRNRVLKAGADMLRDAYAMGAFSPSFKDTLHAVADFPINWRALKENAPLAQITPTDRLKALAIITEDIGKIRVNTSPGEVLLLFPYIDTATDVARFARLSAVSGLETRAMVSVLGKSETFGAMTRVADKTLIAIALIVAFLGQLGLFFVDSVLNRLRRLIVSDPVARPPRSRHDRRG